MEGANKRSIAIHSGLHEDVEDICRKFKNDNTCSLTSLSLRKVQICSASLIAEVLGTNTSLLMLDLSRHRMGSIGATQLCDALASNTTLQTLELSGNPVPFADTWRTMIATRSGILRLAEPGAAAVAGLLSRNRTLTSIGLAHNALGDEGAKILARGLESSTIRSLDLSFNMIGPDGLKELAEILPRVRELEVLDLRVNPIEDNGAKHLANGLESHPSILKVGVSPPKETDSEGWKKLQQVVSSTTTRLEIPHSNKLAILMGLHGRLGRTSWLNVLDGSIVQLVIQAAATDLRRSFMAQEEKVCVFAPSDDEQRNESSSSYGTCELEGL